jgi:hypothetical protein
MTGKSDLCDPKTFLNRASTSMRHYNCHAYYKENSTHFPKTTKEILIKYAIKFAVTEQEHKQKCVQKEKVKLSL